MALENTKQCLSLLDEITGLDYLFFYRTPDGQHSTISSNGLKSLAKKFSDRSLKALDLASIDLQLINDLTYHCKEPFVKTIDLRDETQVVEHLYRLFLEIQQVGCKSIAKCWIRELEPFKQSTYPYKNGANSRPPWWPEDVVHKEPDHIKKEDRVKLLVTLIRTSISNFGSINKKDKFATTAMKLKSCESSYISSLNPEKQSLLNEVYYLSHQEELSRTATPSSWEIKVSDFDLRKRHEQTTSLLSVTGLMSNNIGRHVVNGRVAKNRTIMPPMRKVFRLARKGPVSPNSKTLLVLKNLLDTDSPVSRKNFPNDNRVCTPFNTQHLESKGIHLRNVPHEQNYSITNSNSGFQPIENFDEYIMKVLNSNFDPNVSFDFTNSTASSACPTMSVNIPNQNSLIEPNVKVEKLLAEPVKLEHIQTDLNDILAPSTANPQNGTKRISPQGISMIQQTILNDAQNQASYNPRRINLADSAYPYSGMMAQTNQISYNSVPFDNSSTHNVNHSYWNYAPLCLNIVDNMYEHVQSMSKSFPNVDLSGMGNCSPLFNNGGIPNSEPERTVFDPEDNSLC